MIRSRAAWLLPAMAGAYLAGRVLGAGIAAVDRAIARAYPTR